MEGPNVNDYLRNQHNRMVEEFKKAEGKGFMLGRYGCVENSILLNYLNGKPYTWETRQKAPKHVGLSPASDAVLDRFCQLYLEAIQQSDLISLPNYGNANKKETIMQELSQRFCPKTPKIEYNILEDAFRLSDYPNHWIHMLRDKRVLVVSPYKTTIEGQLPKIKAIYSKVPHLTPSWQSVIVVQSPLTQTDPTDSKNIPENWWINELEEMQKQITELAADFDIALLGCGGYAMPLCLHIKSLGKHAIMYGGALQLLFGIMGQRWEKMHNYKRLLTPEWVRPSEDERPKIWKSIEGGCYW